jgi:hypothetical protein
MSKPQSMSVDLSMESLSLSKRAQAKRKQSTSTPGIQIPPESSVNTIIPPTVSQSTKDSPALPKPLPLSLPGEPVKPPEAEQKSASPPVRPKLKVNSTAADIYDFKPAPRTLKVNKEDITCLTLVINRMRQEQFNLIRRHYNIKM